jgi:hypothetical protein
MFWRSMRPHDTGFSPQRSPADLAAPTRVLAPTEHKTALLLTSPPTPNNRADLAGSRSVFATKMTAPGAPPTTSWLTGSTRRTSGRKLPAALAAPELGVGGTQIAAS